jgi:glycosyltransferase involved in cell wall biosynthesis
MKLSLIIPTRNSGKTIAPTLEAVRLGHRQPDELIVVDGCSDDATPSIAAELGARVVVNAKRHVAGARQLGLEEARYPVVAYTDSDCLPARDWLARIASRFEADPELAGVGGKVILAEPTTPVQAYSATVFESIMRFPDQPLYLHSRGMHGSFPGANCAFRKDAALRVGGFRDFFSNHAEEIDLLWRLIAVRARLLFDPAIVVTHLGYPDTRRKLVRANFNYGIASTKLAKRHIGRQIDWGLYGALWRSLACAARRSCADEWAGLRALQLAAFTSGKVYASVRYGTINL